MLALMIQSVCMIAKPGSQLVYYIKLQCLFVSVCLSVPPFFRHDRLTATKLGMHMQIDVGIIRTNTNLTHPTQGVDPPRGLTHPTQGVDPPHPGITKFKKSPANVMKCPENR